MPFNLPDNALMAAVFAVLKADSTLTNMVTGIYDALPENTAYPYVVLNSGGGTSSDTFDINFRDIAYELQVQTNYEGFKEGNEILNRIHYLLNRNQLTVTGWNVVDNTYQSHYYEKDEVGPDVIRTHSIAFLANMEEQ